MDYGIYHDESWQGGYWHGMLDENDNPQHNYSREELIALLDKHLTERKIKP